MQPYSTNVALHEPVGSRSLPPREPAKFRLKTPKMGPIHFCFVVHGHRGRPADLLYIHDSIIIKAQEKGSFVHVKSTDWRADGASATGNASNMKVRREKRDRLHSSMKKDGFVDDKSDVTNTVTMDNDQTKGSLIVHNTVCNEGKTSDGIVNGGVRLAHEILSVIRFEVELKGNLRQQRDASPQVHIETTITIIGNSLGGLYGRYAIAYLAQILEVDACCKYYLLDGCILIHPNVFCSIASPHLGCAGFTYVPIPRAAELVVAKVMGETGSDLFRLNDLIRLMSTCTRFLTPLAMFQRRVAYANAYGTDFPVPGSTAAFLVQGSDYPHIFEDERNYVDSCPALKKGLIAATLYTIPQKLNTHTSTNVYDDLTTMSFSLDSLGWRKIFIDTRKETPALSLPMSKSRSSGCPIGQLKALSSKVRSSDLERAISTSSIYSVSLPLGHNVICAFSRGAVSTARNCGGRPVMDSLALYLTNEISQWRV